MKRFSDNPTAAGAMGGKNGRKYPGLSIPARARFPLFLYLKRLNWYGTIVVVVGRRQAVKAKDFDSLIEGSNPAGPAQRKTPENLEHSRVPGLSLFSGRQFWFRQFLRLSA